MIVDYLMLKQYSVCIIYMYVYCKMAIFFLLLPLIF